MRNNTKSILIVSIGQLVGLLITILRSLLLPLLMSVKDFGYFQSYTFYISLFPIITLGYNDGIYLRYGKYDYKELPFRLLSGANRIFLTISFIIILLSSVVAYHIIKDDNLLYVFFFSASYAFFLCINGLMLQIFQITKQFKKYSYYSLASKFLSVLLISILLLLGRRNFIDIIFIDLISFMILNAILLFNNKSLFFKKSSYKNSFNEYILNTKVGFSLLIAGLVGILFLGGGRLIVQILGDIELFSKYSFAISIASFVSITISSVSSVVYPLLSRYNKSELQNSYYSINNMIKYSLIPIIPFYYIVLEVIQNFYFKYIQILDFLNIIIIIMYLQSFMYVLHNTFYKVLRLERKLMTDNIIAILLIFLAGFPIFKLTYNLQFVALSTLLAQVIRYIISCYRIQNELDIKAKYNIGELLLVSFFLILSSLDFGSILVSFMLNISMVIIYVIINFKDLIRIFIR